MSSLYMLEYKYPQMYPIFSPVLIHIKQNLLFFCTESRVFGCRWVAARSKLRYGPPEIRSGTRTWLQQPWPVRLYLPLGHEWRLHRLPDDRIGHGRRQERPHAAAGHFHQSGHARWQSGGNHCDDSGWCQHRLQGRIWLCLHELRWGFGTVYGMK